MADGKGGIGQLGLQKRARGAHMGMEGAALACAHGQCLAGRRQEDAMWVDRHGGSGRG
jgi:hypothetical protein